ncbi:MAG: ABC transporter permease [Deltaproteobacteria bacterium]|nr:ABC transporter permease [Deltaproteobacteria bacterium]
MLNYILKRIATGIITVYFIATATFVAMHLVPGDPLASAKAMRPEIRANLEKKYGLDKPLLSQYGVFLGNMLKGDFGISYSEKNRSVNDIIRSHFPISAVLGLLSLFFATLGGVLFGAIAAIRRGKITDRASMFFVILGISVPSFVFAAIAQYLVVKLNHTAGMTVLPVAGWGTFSHMLLPAVVLGIGSLALQTRLMRSSMLEVVHQDYIRTAKAKGLSPLRIFLFHQLRNAILPTVTILGPAIASITTGGFVVESIFAIPGLGRYFVQAFQQFDYTVIMGLTVFYGAFLVGMVLLVDLVYGIIDPRITIAKRNI